MRYLRSTVAVVTVALSILACSGDINAKLLAAAEKGETRQVETLLSKGADINLRDEYERTPLMISAYNGHTDIVALLLEAGADVNPKAKYGQTAHQFAKEQGNEEIVRMLEAAGASN